MNSTLADFLQGRYLYLERGKNFLKVFLYSGRKQLMETSNRVLRSKPWFQEHAQKIIALSFWILLVVVYQWYAASNQLSPLQVVQRTLAFMQNGIWGVLIYVILYAVRPLILFPATFLSVAAGFVFGPLLGVLYTIIASNISSTIAFFIGRFFGEGMLKDDGSDNLVQRYARRMRENSF
ncbi:TVP38/TMEM64 family protein, partial [bacterium]|nr:TVP38/TMEM64 family protein [bacterium]